MTRPPDDHTLNACLARVIGREIRENACGPTNLSWWCWKSETEEDFGEWIKWDPLHDANQMERVKAWLRENNRTYKCVWDITLKVHLVWISEKGFPVYERDVIKGIHESELRAFALAVYAMEQSQKGMT